MKVSILTPFHNDAENLARSLQASWALETEMEIEVIAIDDGSTDESPQIAEKVAASDPRVRIIRKAAGGEASALNLGLKEARGDFIAILEADVEASRAWLAILLKRLEEKDVWGAGGFLMTPPEDPWIGRLAGYEAEYRMARYTPFVMHVTSANALYKREAFDALGVFDETLINSCLDVDFNQKIIAAGKRLAFESQARVWHHFKGTLGGYIRRQYAYARYRPFLKRKIVYGPDRNISAQILLTAFGAAMIPVAALSVWPLAFSFAALLGLMTPMTLELYRKKKDKVLFLMPVMLFCRNVAGIAGLAAGLYEKHLARAVSN